jgi:hypothetical protein
MRSDNDIHSFDQASITKNGKESRKKSNLENSNVINKRPSRRSASMEAQNIASSPSHRQLEEFPVAEPRANCSHRRTIPHHIHECSGLIRGRAERAGVEESDAVVFSMDSGEWCTCSECPSECVGALR